MSKIFRIGLLALIVVVLLISIHLSFAQELSGSVPDQNSESAIDVALPDSFELIENLPEADIFNKYFFEGFYKDRILVTDHTSVSPEYFVYQKGFLDKQADYFYSTKIVPVVAMLKTLWGMVEPFEEPYKKFHEKCPELESTIFIAGIVLGGRELVKTAVNGIPRDIATLTKGTGTGLYESGSYLISGDMDSCFFRIQDLSINALFLAGYIDGASSLQSAFRPMVRQLGTELKRSGIALRDFMSRPQQAVVGLITPEGNMVGIPIEIKPVTLERSAAAGENLINPNVMFAGIRNRMGRSEVQEGPHKVTIYRTEEPYTVPNGSTVRIKITSDSGDIVERKGTLLNPVKGNTVALKVTDQSGNTRIEIYPTKRIAGDFEVLANPVKVGKVQIIPLKNGQTVEASIADIKGSAVKFYVGDETVVIQEQTLIEMNMAYREGCKRALLEKLAEAKIDPPPELFTLPVSEWSNLPKGIGIQYEEFFRKYVEQAGEMEMMKLPCAPKAAKRAFGQSIGWPDGGIPSEYK